MSENKIELAGNSPIIRLPRDSELKKSLMWKRKEYALRLKKKQLMESSSHPDFVKIDSPSYYKEKVLSHLLSDRKVDTHKLSLYLTEKNNGFNAHEFCVACGVVEDYCDTRGKVAKGGTGLNVNNIKESIRRIEEDIELIEQSGSTSSQKKS